MESYYLGVFDIFEKEKVTNLVEIESDSGFI